MFELGAGLYRKGELKGELRGERKNERRKNLEVTKGIMKELGYSQEDAIKFLKRIMTVSDDEEKNLLEDLEAEKKRQQEVIQ